MSVDKEANDRAIDAVMKAADLLEEWASTAQHETFDPGTMRASVASAKRAMDALSRGLPALGANITRQAAAGQLYHEDEAFHGDGVIGGPKLDATVKVAIDELDTASRAANRATTALREARHHVMPIGAQR